jgi:quercetin dioxygenase-like cupin family protein
MRSIRKIVVVAPLVLGFVLGWFAHAGSGVASAQARKPIMMTRIYTGPDGLSHSEQVEMKLTPNGTSTMKATSIEFSSRPAAPAGDWHTGPRRQFVITLSGRAELEIGNGQTVPIGPGNINLIEDTTGKGHITHNIEDRVVATIPIE